MHSCLFPRKLQRTNWNVTVHDVAQADELAIRTNVLDGTAHAPSARDGLVAPQLQKRANKLHFTTMLTGACPLTPCRVLCIPPSDDGAGFNHTKRTKAKCNTTTKMMWLSAWGVLVESLLIVRPTTTGNIHELHLTCGADRRLA